MLYTSEHLSKIIRDELYSSALSADVARVYPTSQNFTSCMLSNLEAAGMELMYGVLVAKEFQEHHRPTCEMVQVLQNFIVHAVENFCLNQITTDLLKLSANYENTNFKIPAILITNLLTHATRKYSMAPSAQKLQLIIAYFSSDKEEHNIPKGMQFSGQELGIILDLASIYDILHALYDRNILSNNRFLCELHQKASICYDINLLLAKSTILSDHNLINSAFASYDFNKNQMLHSLHYFHSRLAQLIDALHYKTMHTNDVLRSQDATQVKQNLLNTLSYIKVDTIFFKESQKMLSRLYGKNWKEEVLLMMKEIENKIIGDSVYRLIADGEPGSPRSFGKVHCSATLSELDGHALQENNHVRYALRKDYNMFLSMTHSESDLAKKIIRSLDQKIRIDLEKKGIECQSKIIKDESGAFYKQYL